MLNRSLIRKSLFSVALALVAVAMSACIQVRSIGRAGNQASLIDVCADSSGAVPALHTKNISGRPGTTGNISITGDAAHLKLRFRDQNGAVIDQSPSASGNIVLPARSGLYSVELLDECTERFSYGLATVNDAFTTWTPSATTTALAMGYYRVWPNVSQAIGDFNEDGKLDYAVASGVTGAGVLSNTGIHLFRLNAVTNALVFHSKIIEASGARGLKAVDLNGDGHLDLVWTTFTPTKLKIAYGDGTGVFAPALALDLPNPGALGTPHVYDLVIADLNRDGNIDFALAGGYLNGAVWTGAIFWYLNDGDGNLTENVIYGVPGYPFQSLAIADSDDDGRLDLFAFGQNPSPHLFRFLQAEDGSYSYGTLGTHYLKSAPAHGNFPYDQVTVGYLNSDSKPDAVVMHPDGPSSVFLSNATNTTLAAAAIPSFADQHGARSTIADFDGDGVQEIYMPLKNRALFANKSGILRKTATNLTAAASPNATNTILGSSGVFGWAFTDMITGDLDGDGKVDIIMPITQNNVIEVIRGQ